MIRNQYQKKMVFLSIDRFVVGSTNFFSELPIFFGTAVFRFNICVPIPNQTQIQSKEFDFQFGSMIHHLFGSSFFGLYHFNNYFEQIEFFKKIYQKSGIF